jgi:hypothetical protein
LHIGKHAAPESKLDVQVPLLPFAGLADASHGSGSHVAAVSFPAEQLVGPVTLYPLLQKKMHFDPDARLFVQVPTVPFAGGVDASHGLGLHVATGAITPAEQLDRPDTV